MRINKYVFLVLMIGLLPFKSNSQGALYKYFIRFSDKNGSQYSTANPSAFLSQRALNRRATQQIAVVDQDIPVNQNYIDSLTVHGARVFARSKWFNGATVECDSTVLADILNLPFVLGAKHVLRQSEGAINKNETLLMNPVSALRTMSYDYGGSFNQIHLMNGEYLHTSGFNGEGMVIALLDAGFYMADQLPAFDSLFARSGVLGTWDFVMDETSVYEDDSHGMAVLSTIAGNVPGELVGTAPLANFWLLRSEDAWTEYLVEEYNWASAAEFADSVGADVISSSLGYSEFLDASMNHSYSDMDGNTCPSSIAADIAVSKGMLVLVSAGNSGGNSWHYISAPADADSVLAVAAVDADGNYVGFSSWGPSSDGDVKPNVAAKGLDATLSSGSGFITQGSGTSFACPILAGSATCLWQAHPSAFVMDVKRAIEESANYYTTPTDSMGYGIPNFATADFLLGVPTLTQNSNLLFSVFPNPVNEMINLRLYAASAGLLTVEVYNNIGERVLKSTTSLSGAINQMVHIPLSSDLADGLYYLKLSTATMSGETKLVRIAH